MSAASLRVKLKESVTFGVRAILTYIAQQRIIKRRVIFIANDIISRKYEINASG